MRLSDLLQTIQPVRIAGSTSMEITGVNIDSRLIGTGHLFMAMRGTQTDGHAYIPAAINKGAVAVLCEELPEELKAGITYIQVKDSEDAVGSGYHFLWRPYIQDGTHRRDRNQRKNNRCHLII